MTQIDYFKLGREISAASRAAQGLPPKVQSPEALARVAALLELPEPTPEDPPKP